QSTVRATQSATVAELKKSGRERLQRLLRQGVTTVEIKSGYGLTLAAESKILSVAKSLNGPQRVIRTYLGPHAVPGGRSATEYLSECIRWLNDIKKSKLSDRVDIFVEKGFFSAEQGRSF